MRVYGEGGNLERVNHHDACRLVTDTGERLKFFESLRNNAVVLFDKNLG